MQYKTNREVSQELQSLFQKFDSHRKQWEEKAIANYKLYRGWKDARKDGDNNRSNLHIPRTYEVVDTIRARLLKSFFDQRPYLDFIPQPEGGTVESLNVSEQKAQVASALVDMQLDKNKIISKFYDYITSLLIFPAAILSVGWRYEQQKVKKRIPRPQIAQTPYGPRTTGWNYEEVMQWETTWDDNEINLVDFFDFWADPKATSIEDARGVFHREWCTREELERKLQLLGTISEGVVYRTDLEQLQNTSVEQGRDLRMSEVGLSGGENDAYIDDEKKDSFELLHYWEDGRHAILVNRSECIYDGPNPYWRHRTKPFVVQTYEPLPSEFYGMSAVEIIHDLQHEENTQHNQRIDNVSLVLNKMVKARRGSDIDESDLISRPGGIVWLDQMDDVIPFDFGGISQSAFMSEQAISKNIENALGTPAIVRGAEASRSRTATEVSHQSSSAGIRFDTKILLFESLGITRMARLMDMNNQQFIDDERLVKVGKDEETSTWQTVTPGEIMGQFDYRPAGSNIDPAANKEVRRDQLTNMMMFLMQSQNPFVDYQKLTKEWIESFDVRNPEKFLLDKQQIQERQMQQQQGQQQQGPTQGQRSTGKQGPQSPKSQLSQMKR